ncbi:lipid droplet assembly factor 1-A-like isoform X2 [Centropristis striata]|uniref:lipid droplet assembly factor 1-A-like isoform X2 n=1 Tax=Centropristis striata TaxID=184440 RepID=UPI0027E02DED|nr:lipid droplet assembly factor 1-A-like isoform X2 [Centropristis striata]
MFSISQMSVEMKPNNNSSSEIQQLWGSWTNQLNRFYDDPKVSQLMNTRLGRYLSNHPFSALTLMLFAAMAAVPVGIFLTFALVTIIMSTVAFVFFEVFLLSVGGMTLLCVLSGIAFFSVVVAAIFNVLFISVSNILIRYYPHLIKQGKVQEEQSECETSAPKETQ